MESERNPYAGLSEPERQDKLNELFDELGEYFGVGPRAALMALPTAEEVWWARVHRRWRHRLGRTSPRSKVTRAVTP